MQLAVEGPRVPDVRDAEMEELAQFNAFLETAYRLRLAKPRRGPGPKKTFFCVPTDELLWAKDDLLGEGRQSLNSIFADCFDHWFIGIPFLGDDGVAKCISKLH